MWFAQYPINEPKQCFEVPMMDNSEGQKTAKRLRLPLQMRETAG
jgi:hypothetical protein